MTLIQLKEQVDKLIAQGYGENPVVIPTMGLSGSNSPVKSINWGFDWDAGRVLIFPERQLSNICPSRFEKVMKLLLYKISNLRNVQEGKTLAAKYKKEEKIFEKRFEAEMWLWNKLREELGK